MCQQDFQHAQRVENQNFASLCLRVGATDVADLTARWFNFNVGATDVADLTARWFQFIPGATDMADLTARSLYETASDLRLQITESPNQQITKSPNHPPTEEVNHHPPYSAFNVFAGFTTAACSACQPTVSRTTIRTARPATANTPQLSGT